jgi:hypothetical protein
MAKTFDWSKSCSYDERQKSAFHREARLRLKAVASALGLLPESYDLRSNKGGIAVSGEVTLHGEAIYMQASQPFAGGPETGLLIRSCKGRKDYTGGPNNFAPLSMLEDPKALATRVLRISPDVRPDLPTPDAEMPRSYGR